MAHHHTPPTDAARVRHWLERELAGETSAARLAFSSDEIAPASRHLRDRSPIDRPAHGLWDEMEEKDLDLAGLLSRLVEDVVSRTITARPADDSPLAREVAALTQYAFAELDVERLAQDLLAAEGDGRKRLLRAPGAFGV